MQLSSIEFPVSFYGISSSFGNNFLYLEVNYNSFTTPSTIIDTSSVIIIPDGNFNALDLVSNINNLLCPTNTDNSLIYPNSVFSYIKLFLDVNINGSGSGKVTIKPNGAYASNINNICLDFTKDINGIVDNQPLTTKLGWNLGYQKKVYSNTTTYVADTLIEPSTTRYFYLVVDDFNNSVNNHFISVFNKSLLSPNILARIAIRGSYFSIIMENDFTIVSEPRKYFGPVDIQKLKIQIIDEYGKIINMNNSNFSFCINFKMLYDL
jgi:hypothetical protein